MITNTLLCRMIKEVGVGAAVCSLNYSPEDTDAAIADFVEQRTPRLVLRACGVKGQALTEAGNLHDRATHLAKTVVFGKASKRSLTAVNVRRAFLLHLAAWQGREHVGEALVAGVRGYVLAWVRNTGSVGGSGVIYIKKLGGKHWHCDSQSGYVSPPFSSLKEAIKHDELLVDETTERIYCQELSSSQIAELLRVSKDARVDHVVSLNGIAYAVGEDRALVRLDTRKTPDRRWRSGDLFLRKRGNS